MNDDEDEDNLISIFKECNVNNDVFFFKDITVQLLDDSFNQSECENIIDDHKTKVLITYTYCVKNETTFGVEGEGVDFQSSIEFNDVVNVHQTIAKRILFCIGMCLLSWYWMGFGTTRIMIGRNVLSYVTVNDSDIKYWSEFYNNIFLEYLFINFNGREFIISLEMETDEDDILPAIEIIREESSHLADNKSSQKILVPIGGGKDSLVVYDMIRYANTLLEPALHSEPILKYSCDGLLEYTLSWRLQSIFQMTQCPFHIVPHTFPDQNHNKYARSYLKPCGHPWAALILYDSLLVCESQGIRRILLGHERSADEGNGIFINNTEVNHQYDKSSDFIQRSREYIHLTIDPSYQIQSALSSLWELQIARFFCLKDSLKPFHSSFLSCNEPIQINSWCCQCDKCIFIFLLLSAWLPPTEVCNVFHGNNLFSNESLLPTFMRLIGLNGTKPFDCVGPFREAMAALILSIHQYETWVGRPWEGSSSISSHVHGTIVEETVTMPSKLVAIGEYPPRSETAVTAPVVAVMRPEYPVVLIRLMTMIGQEISSIESIYDEFEINQKDVKYPDSLLRSVGLIP